MDDSAGNAQSSVLVLGLVLSHGVCDGGLTGLPG